MKVVSSKQMAEIESLAYREGSSAEEFMDEAGSGVALMAHEYAETNFLDRTIILLCGRGNNAGDAYVAGIDLLHLDYDVTAVQVEPIEEATLLCRQNHQRFLMEGGRVVDSLNEFPSSSLIIDGIFGTGFHGTISEPYATLVRAANDSKLPILAIDIPSGLNGDNGLTEGEAIVATETAFLGLPKSGFFLHQGWNHVGKLRYVDFGLPKQLIDNCEASLIMTSVDMMRPLLPPVKRNQHKYEAGYVVGLSGSVGMSGAAILSAISALRAGAGIVRLLHPDGIQMELANSPYELIKQPYHPDDIHTIAETMNQASATYVGPGLGRSNQTRQLLRVLLPTLQTPCVIDADALTIISEEEITLPRQTVMTPHMGEMRRLLKIDKLPLSIELLDICQEFCNQKNITLVLKGGPTFIFHPGELVRVNSTGDPGMATAGSGDVLTGLIASLLAQGLAPHDAATLGVFLHGLAGEHAAQEMTSRGVIASDIIYRYPEAFKFTML